MPESRKEFVKQSRKNRNRARRVYAQRQAVRVESEGGLR